MPLAPRRYEDLLVYIASPPETLRTMVLSRDDALEMVRYVEQLRLDRIRTADGLLTDLLAELGRVVADNGRSESAVEVCHRLTQCASESKQGCESTYQVSEGRDPILAERLLRERVLREAESFQKEN